MRGGRVGLRAELAADYARLHDGQVPSQQALADALLALEGAARMEPPEPTALRVARHETGVLLDLGRDDGHVVYVDGRGWWVLEESPVLFRRTTLTGELPTPSAPGSLEPLRRRLNVTDVDWPLLTCWLVAVLLPDIPHPLLAVTGEQGTGKSTATRLLTSLLDPSPAPLRAAPKDLEQWAVAAAGSWVVALDNLSGITLQISDALCRAVTGDGLVRRRLFSDSDIEVLSFRRVVILNGIDLGCLRGDLADRLLTVELERIDPSRRRRDGEFVLPAVEHAAVLAGILDLAADILSARPNVQVERLPRMADYAHLLAISDVLTTGNALDRYREQANNLADTVIGSDRFTIALRSFVDQRGDWIGSPADLLDELPAPLPGPRGWPTTGQGVAGALKRAAPALRELGYTAERMTARQAGTGRAQWHLARPPRDVVDGTSQSSESSVSPASEVRVP